MEQISPDLLNQHWQQLSQDESNFLAMLAEETLNPNIEFNQELLVPNQQQVNMTPQELEEDIVFNFSLAMSPHDPHQSSLIKQAMEEANGSEDMQMDTNQCLAEDLYTNRSPDPQMYSTNQYVHPEPTEETAQFVPIRDPMAMVSGTTIDHTQLQMMNLAQAMSVEPASPASTLSSSTLADISADSQEDISPPAVEEPQTCNGRRFMPPLPPAHKDPQLPDVKELLIRIRYRAAEVVREHIGNSHGCLAYFGTPPKQQELSGRTPACVQFPAITKQQQQMMTESQYKFTMQVLKALERGLYMRCDPKGNVYATRFCRSKIFWYSTEVERESPVHPPKLSFQKLERNVEVLVFNNTLFQEKLLHYVVNKPTFKNEAAKLPPNKHVIPISPAIFFTFAQSWNPMNSALSSCLVSMVVNPMRARKQRQWGNEDCHESYDLSDYKLLVSDETK